MSFGGFVSNMVQSIRNNNALLKKESAFIQFPEKQQQIEDEIASWVKE